MIQSVKITNYIGDSIELPLAFPEESGLAIAGISGLGPAKGNINVTDIVTNDGALFNSARLDTRNIVMTLVFMEYFDGKSSIEDIRHLTYKYFPVKKPLTIEIITDRRDLQITGYVESNEPSIWSSMEATQISIICPDPYFYSVDADRDETTFSGLEGGFEFPFENDDLKLPTLEFSNIVMKTENVVPYTGDAEIGITIRIHAIGEVGDITIFNVGTRERMVIENSKIESLTGSGIKRGDDITICTVKGKKSITLTRDGQITNILNCIGKNSDWFVLTKGDNIFAYTASYGAVFAQLTISNNVIYEGV